MVDEDVVTAGSADHAVNGFAELLVTYLRGGVFAASLRPAHGHSGAPLGLRLRIRRANCVKCVSRDYVQYRCPENKRVTSNQKRVTAALVNG